MAATSMPALKRRLKTVGSTKKITMAVGLVATSKYQRARIMLGKNQEHFDAFLEIFHEVLESSSDPEFEKASPYLESPEPLEPALIIAFTSDRGMVSGYNSALIDRVKELYHAEVLEPYVTVMGARGVAPLKKLVPQEQLSVLSLEDLPDFSAAQRLIKQTLHRYLQGRIREIRVVFPRYLSALQYEIIDQVILPIPQPKQRRETRDSKYEFEPQVSEIRNEIFRMYLGEQIYNIMLHAKTVEHSTRMKAMDSAKRNADELLFVLSRQLNRLRQTTITQEITEIIGGAEALK